LRLAIVATPRSGNTWLKRLIASTYGIHDAVYYSPDEIRWADLPAECVIGVHWRHDAAFATDLVANGFRVIVVARHPLDVLVSIVHFAAYDGETGRWLAGQGGNESELIDEAPAGEAFGRYATGERARALLAVSPEWVREAARVVRYEDLLADPAAELGRLADAVGVEPRVPLRDAVEANTLTALRAAHLSEHHFWQGRGGLWRELVPPETAFVVESAHPDAFRAFGYVCNPRASLSRGEATVNWARLEAGWSRDALARMRARIADASAREAAATKLAAELHGQLAEVDAERGDTSRRLDTTHRELLETIDLLATAVQQRNRLQDELTAARRELREHAAGGLA
jgi:hypothetical protein